MVRCGGHFRRWDDPAATAAYCCILQQGGTRRAAVPCTSDTNQTHSKKKGNGIQRKTVLSHVTTRSTPADSALH